MLAGERFNGGKALVFAAAHRDVEASLTKKWCEPRG
jgi:hypothetical protein